MTEDDSMTGHSAPAMEPEPLVPSAAHKERLLVHDARLLVTQSGSHVAEVGGGVWLLLFWMHRASSAMHMHLGGKPGPQPAARTARVIQACLQRAPPPCTCTTRCTRPPAAPCPWASPWPAACWVAAAPQRCPAGQMCSRWRPASPGCRTCCASPLGAARERRSRAATSAAAHAGSTCGRAAGAAHCCLAFRGRQSWTPGVFRG